MSTSGSTLQHTWEEKGKDPEVRIVGETRVKLIWHQISRTHSFDDQDLTGEYAMIAPIANLSGLRHQTVDELVIVGRERFRARETPIDPTIPMDLEEEDTESGSLSMELA